MEDLRYKLAKERLETLSKEELQRILDDIDKCTWDTWNYEKETDQFCPIAIAMNLHNTVDNPTDENIKAKMAERFQPTNIFKGTPGEFYTTNRKQDTIKLVTEILKTK